MLLLVWGRGWWRLDCLPHPLWWAKRYDIDPKGAKYPNTTKLPLKFAASKDAAQLVACMLSQSTIGYFTVTHALLLLASFPSAQKIRKRTWCKVQSLSNKAQVTTIHVHVQHACSKFASIFKLTHSNEVKHYWVSSSGCRYSSPLWCFIRGIICMNIPNTDI